MSPLNALIFGLGLFFLGLRLVGENLKGLAGGSLRESIMRTTEHPLRRVGLGLLAGALMQSATAVTFIGVSMVAAGLLQTSAAAVLIVWCNVGLTALAFVATFNIHPIVAFVVGGAGIVLGVVRVRSWQTVAGVLLGMGLILLGLQQMSEGAAPLRGEEWFRSGISFATSSAPLAFLAGLLAAAILQSNTGATMLVITLAGAGAIPFETAAVLIYGTNLGAIALRWLLAAGMQGDGLRLVRLEDLFCVLSGVLMLVLYAVEQAGVPLVLAFAGKVAPREETALAVVFLLSNLLPALVLMPLLSPTLKLLKRLFPSEPVAAPGSPKYLSPRALVHPSSALDLVRRELARLISFTSLGRTDAPQVSANAESGPPPGFASLSTAIEEFLIRLAAVSGLNEKEVEVLHRLRAALSGVRHLEEAGRFYAARVEKPGAVDVASKRRLDAVLASFITEAAAGLDGGDPDKIAELVARSKKHGDFLEGLRSEVFPGGGIPASLETSALFEDFHLVIWTYHHLMQILAKIPFPQRAEPPASS